MAVGLFNNSTLQYTGLGYLATGFLSRAFDPTSNDWKNFRIGTFWLNSDLQKLWFLISLTGNRAKWVLVGSGYGSLIGLTADIGGTAVPTGGLINIHGGAGIQTAVTGMSEITITATGSGTLSTLTGDNTGTPVSPMTGNINIIADTTILNCGSSVSILGNNSDATLVLNVTDSNENTIIGNLAGKIGITGAENTGLGASSLSSLTSGSGNIALGYAAASDLLTGSNNILIGVDAGVHYVGAESHNIILGPSTGTAATSGEMYLGDFTNTTSTYVAGIYGTSLSGSSVVVTSSGQLGVGSGGGGTVTGLFTTFDSHTVTPTAGVIQIAGGTGIVVTGTVGPNTVTISATGITTLTYTNVNTSPYVVLTTDEYLSVDCSSIPITLEFPNAATLSRAWIVKDRTGNAATNNITVTTVGGAVNIDGATSFVANTNFESINIIGNGSTYEIY